MISFDLANLHKVDPAHGLSTEEIATKSEHITPYLKSFKKRDQGFYQIVDDTETIAKINAYAEQAQGQFDDIIVFGIGGSSLGTICLQQSLKHLFENQLTKRDYPRLHVIDNIDPTWIAQIDNLINYERTLFIIITKSGGTPETLSEYFYIRSRCDEKGLDPKKHFVFVTDPERGLLRKISNEEGITAFEIPPNVGGRFSVLTPVGLLPAKLIGIDIEALLAGARTVRDQFLSEDFDTNLPFQLAAIQYLSDLKGKRMNVIMPYSQRLVRFADWYRQLLAESIGKEKNDDGETVNTGLTPINALGVTDQHSQSQLYTEGPNDKLFIFLEVADLGPELKIPNLFPNEEKVSYIKDTSFNELMLIEKRATADSFTEYQKPNLTIKIDQVNATSLGELFMLFEASIAFLGEFYNINAFDQPGVELSKNLTKKYLLNR